MLVLAPATCCLAAIALSDLMNTCCASIKSRSSKATDSAAAAATDGKVRVWQLLALPHALMHYLYVYFYVVLPRCVCALLALRWQQQLVLGLDVCLGVLKNVQCSCDF
jgi:hypothetical protein